MNCLSCKNNINEDVMLINGNCINICLNSTFMSQNGDCVSTCPNGTYLFSLNNSCLESCPHNYVISNKKCIFKSFDKNTTVNEFKNQIKNNIFSYVNSTNIINGSNFQAVVLSSDDIDPEKQLKNGMSSFDLGNCTNVLKEYYNISKENNLIIINMEIKDDKNQKNEINNIDEDKSIYIGKSTYLEIYDYSGRKLNFSICKENIKIMKYIGDVEQLNIDSAKTLSQHGIDVFNPADDFFNDICHLYENIDNKDIILTDRRNDIFQNVTFCQDGCIYNGINYNLMVANCLCNSSLLQKEEDNKIKTQIHSETVKFKTLTKSFLENLFNFNFDIIRCYNLALNLKILIHNIGFYCLASMLFLQIIFFCVYSIKKIKPLKIFMLAFKIDDNKKRKSKKRNMITRANKKLNKNIIKSTPPPKNNNSSKNLLDNQKSKYNKSNYNNQKIFGDDKKVKKKKLSLNQPNFKIIFRESVDSTGILNLSNISKSKKNSMKNVFISNNFSPTININIENRIKDENNFKIDFSNNNDKKYNIKSNKLKNIDNSIGKINLENFHKMETYTRKKINSLINPKNNKFGIIKLAKNDSDIQDMDYEEAIIYDNRTYLRMYWGFLVDSQIILGTFCTDNHLDLFIIKLSFLVFTFQISFFLNAFFYTDDYISDAYHNDGVLDFFSGLPKSIYSFVATLITTNLLRMLSSSKSELMKIIKRNKQYKNYINVVNIKLAKLRKKLIIYFILLFLLDSFFLYYVTVFCAVYKFSQKYWFLGCLESFGIDSIVAISSCIFLALFRYISIKSHIKYMFRLIKIISAFM